MKKKSDQTHDKFVHTKAQDVGSEHEVRIRKAYELRAQGIEPYGEAQSVEKTTHEIINEFATGNPEPKYVIAGRIITLRLHGKTSFATIQDRTGRLQIYIKQEVVGEELYELWKHYIDIGDIVWFCGSLFRTKTGEITLNVSKFKLLTKCLHPLPEKFHGLADIEARYRQRYLDLIAHPESKEKFIKRAQIIKEMRAFLDNYGFIEVETPMLHPIAGGATARPFETYHHAYDENFYLRIAPELYLKRLVIGGIERVYEINRNFRNEGVSTKHNPEFTMCEFYMAHHDYQYIMDFVEDMLRIIVQQVHKSLCVPYGDIEVDFTKPFVRMTMKESIVKIGGIAESAISSQKMATTLKEHNIVLERKNASYGEQLFALFEELVEAKLIQPTFIYEFPIEVSPLAHRLKDNPSFAARCELFIAGMEISNAFNELNDPFEQAERFNQQLEAHRAGDTEAHQFDADYILALEHALPPSVGVGIGIDRLVMILTNTPSIKDVIFFPTLKKKK